MTTKRFYIYGHYGFSMGQFKMAEVQLRLLILAGIFLLFVQGRKEACSFPNFLQSDLPDGTIRPWTTRMWWLFLRHSPKWQERQEIIVRGGYMSRQRERVSSNCAGRLRRRIFHTVDGDGDINCVEPMMDVNRTCISEDRPNVFRMIQYYADRTHRFTCMKFVKRGDNVVQVYEGRLSDTNDSDLCDEDSLILDDWPWTGPATQHKNPTFCPVSGGFSFRTIKRLTSEDFCEDDWRRSSLEIECMRGDGMEFIAPKGSKCNPFLKNGDSIKLSCWAGWQHGNFTFIIASREGGQPAYCIRFPRVMDGVFSVLVYFSVICPTEPDGKAPSGIEYYELKMYRKQPHLCLDEDPVKCLEMMFTPDRCAKDDHYAPHCQKTCGRCPSSVVHGLNRRRCHFDPATHGDFKLYGSLPPGDVHIESKSATFNFFSSFQCLEHDKHTNRHKAATVFENGCQPRYTCLQFKRLDQNVLQYRISPSERTEMEMDKLCTFRDDLPPLRDHFRSYYYKNLILAENLWPAYCGFTGTIPFNGTINGRQCAGTISDWDEENCMQSGVLKLHSTTCRELVLDLEFQCLKHISDSSQPLQELLLTRSLDGRDTYTCWVITSYIDYRELPYRRLYHLPTSQCSLLMEVDATTSRQALAVLELNDAAIRKDCKPMKADRPSIAQNDITKSSVTDLSYKVPMGDGETLVHVKTDPPIAPPTPPIRSSDPPYLGVYDRAGTFERQSYTNIVLCLLVTFAFINQFFVHEEWYR